jgi:hypothetical protein
MSRNENENQIEAGVGGMSGHEQITSRYPDDRVTDRFQVDRVTERLEMFRPAEHNVVVPERAQVDVGELVADRFRVKDGPLNVLTSEADIFLCEDEGTGESFILKYYHENITPKQDILDKLMRVSHPDIVTLKACGAWAGHFYEVMDYCKGGGLAEYMPFDEDELRRLLVEILSGLRYLHDHGIVHRDIKPTNLFFRKPNKQDLVIGDFGVSSIMDANETVRKTTTSTFFTLDYAAPELIDGKEVSPKTDFYALGVTLIHLFEGKSPFSGMDKNAILGCHFRGMVPRPKNVSDSFRKLLNGLLRVVPENRWGYRQIADWLDGVPVFTDDGLADRDDIYAGKRMPYRNLPKASTPMEMASRLAEFDVANDLRKGYISQWAMFFDEDLGRRIACVEEEFDQNPTLGAFQLRYLLDPTQALEIGRYKIYNVAELLNILLTRRSECGAALISLLYSGSIAVWIAALQESNEAKNLAEEIAAIRKRLPDYKLGLFSLLYTLDPSRPLYLSTADFVKTPEEFERFMGKNVEITRTIGNMLRGGYLEEWMRCSHPHRMEDIQFLKSCANAYGEDVGQALFALCCHFNPNTPFVISSKEVKDPVTLARLIDSEPYLWERGVRLLLSGWIRTWLVCTGRIADPSNFDAIVNDPTSSEGRKMEAVLHLLNPDLPWPTPCADAERIDAHGVSAESSRFVYTTIYNMGRGYLSGVATLRADGWETVKPMNISMETTPIEGESVTLRICLHGTGLMVGAEESANLIVSTNGGDLEIPIHFHVLTPFVGMIKRSLGIGVVGGLVLGAFRASMQWILPEYTQKLVPSISYADVQGNTSLWAFIMFGGIILTGLVFFIYLAVRVFLYYNYGIGRDYSRLPGYFDVDAPPPGDDL